MRAHFGLPSVTNGSWAHFTAAHSHCKDQGIGNRAPITVKYEIPDFTVSGIQLRSLRIVEEIGYQAIPWVRYITENGDYYR